MICCPFLLSFNARIAHELRTDTSLTIRHFYITIESMLLQRYTHTNIQFTIQTKFFILNDLSWVFIGNMFTILQAAYFNQNIHYAYVLQFEYFSYVTVNVYVYRFKSNNVGGYFVSYLFVGCMKQAHSIVIPFCLCFGWFLDIFSCC